MVAFKEFAWRFLLRLFFWRFLSRIPFESFFRGFSWKVSLEGFIWWYLLTIFIEDSFREFLLRFFEGSSGRLLLRLLLEGLLLMIPSFRRFLPKLPFQVSPERFLSRVSLEGSFRGSLRGVFEAFREQLLLRVLFDDTFWRFSLRIPLKEEALFWGFLWKILF